MEIPRSLMTELEQQNIILFVGADFPQSLTGVPSRQELAKIMAEEKGVKSYHSLAEIAGYGQSSDNRYQFTKLIINHYTSSDLRPQPIHAHIAELIKKFRIETIISLSYDELLRQAFNDKGGCTFVVESQARRFFGKNKPQLINLLGTAQRPDTLSVIANDFQWPEEKQLIFDLVKAEFYAHSVLFLGHRLSERADLDFLLKFDNPGDKFHQPNFAILEDVTTMENDRWKQFQANVIEIAPMDFLEILSPSEKVLKPVNIQENPGVRVPIQQAEDETIDGAEDSPSKDKFIQVVEKELEKDMYWQEPGLDRPENGKNLARAYFTQQVYRTKQVRNSLDSHWEKIGAMNLLSHYFFDETNDILNQAQQQCEGICQLLVSAFEKVSNINLFESANDVILKARKTRNSLVQYQLESGNDESKLIHLETDLFSLRISLENLEKKLVEISNLTTRPATSFN